MFVLLDVLFCVETTSFFAFVVLAAGALGKAQSLAEYIQFVVYCAGLMDILIYFLAECHQFVWKGYGIYAHELLELFH